MEALRKMCFFSLRKSCKDLNKDRGKIDLVRERMEFKEHSKTSENYKHKNVYKYISDEQRIV